jgi:hypothetical protein
MLALGVDEFQTRFPDGGDTLHAQLQLWKTGEGHVAFILPIQNANGERSC